MKLNQRLPCSLHNKTLNLLTHGVRENNSRYAKPDILREMYETSKFTNSHVNLVFSRFIIYGS